MDKEEKKARELIQAVDFRRELSELMNMTRRHHNKLDATGVRFKKGWYERMRRDKQFNVSFFSKSFIDILKKESPLSSEKRKVIVRYCMEAAKKTAEKRATQKINL